MTLTTRTVTNAGAPLHATDGAVLANATITFTLVDHIGGRSDAWDAVTSERVGGDPIAVTTDAMGEFSVALWPNSRGSTATRYLCTVNSAGFRPIYGVVEDAAQPLPWVSFMASGTPLTLQEISQLTQYLGEIEAARAAAIGALATKVDSSDPRLSDAREWTATTVTQPEAEAGTDTVRKAWTALRVWQAIGAWWSASAAKAKLDGIAAGATANATDAQLRDRATHTGAQAISTVTGLQGALDAKEAAGTAAAAVSAHAAAGDPHPQYTTAAEAAAAAPVQSVAGKTGAVTLTKADVGLSNVDNTSDVNKPVSNIDRIGKTSAYTLQDADKGAMIDCSGTWTLGADAGIAAGWWAYVRNTGSGGITIDPAGATTIGGAATYALPPGVALLLVRSASGFETVAIQSDTIGTVVSATTTPPDGTWLPCDSSVYLQSSYVALSAKLGLLPDAPVLAGVFTQRTLPVSANWYSVTYGGGVFVAVTYGSTIAATSPDGITWTQRTLPVSANWDSVTYGGGMFVAVTYGSTIAATSGKFLTYDPAAQFAVPPPEGQIGIKQYIKAA